MPGQGVCLGIHVGHHASCALACDGEVLAAIQLERLSRRKHHSIVSLTDDLPIRECLAAAGVSLDAVDLIVSSFQAAGQGGVGLQNGLVAAHFGAFAPERTDHYVISHHLAHAASAYFASGFTSAAVLVADLGGSSTTDGLDFVLLYREWARRINEEVDAQPIRTECLSIYDAEGVSLRLLDREFVIPSSAPEIFVCSAASLYDNVSRAVFRRENAHGELMALATLAPQTGRRAIQDIVHIDARNLRVRFMNGWQSRVKLCEEQTENAALASTTQEAFEQALLTYVRCARLKTGRDHLSVAGGIFLNISANTRISYSGLFSKVFVPSAPHDAGIAIGCALYGDRVLMRRSSAPAVISCNTDRLGPVYTNTDIDASLQPFRLVVQVQDYNREQIVDRLARDEIVARWAGRSEFGPRALGGRSLLAAPFSREVKDVLNEIKGRQKWRPVAPIIPLDQLSLYFDGPECAPFMSFSYKIKQCHRTNLEALYHPDGSARVQTLMYDTDPELHELLYLFGLKTGFPILANTSFNGQGEPIVEHPTEALELFLRSPRIDCLILGDKIVTRMPSWHEGIDRSLRLAVHRDAALVASALAVVLIRGARRFDLDVPSWLMPKLINGIAVEEILDGEAKNLSGSLFQALLEGFLELKRGPLDGTGRD
jgi:carbamoyltransferase